MHLVISCLLPLSHLDRHSLYLSTLVVCPHLTLFPTAYYCITAEITNFSFHFFFPSPFGCFSLSFYGSTHLWKSRRLANSDSFGCFSDLTFFNDICIVLFPQLNFRTQHQAAADPVSTLHPFLSSPLLPPAPPSSPPETVHKGSKPTPSIPVEFTGAFLSPYSTAFVLLSAFFTDDARLNPLPHNKSLQVGFPFFLFGGKITRK